MSRIEPHCSRPLVAFSVMMTIVTIAHITVATPSAGAQAARPNACGLVDATQVLTLTGRTDLFGKGPQVQDPSEIPQYTSGCHFLEILFLLDSPFPPERFARARRSTETGGLLTVQSVSGVGDEAYYEWDPRPGDFRLVGLVFRSGNTRVTIADNIPSDSIETMKKWLLPIAKTAASRVK